MKLSKNIRYLVRVRDYETVHVEIGAEASHLDLGIDDDDLTKLSPEEWDTLAKSLRAMVDSECHQLARSELEVISEWSEIEPNLAQDFLHQPPPAYLHRRVQHAHRDPKKTDPPPNSGKLRRGTGRAPTPPAA